MLTSYKMAFRALLANFWLYAIPTALFAGFAYLTSHSDIANEDISIFAQAIALVAYFAFIRILLGYYSLRFFLLEERFSLRRLIPKNELTGRSGIPAYLARAWAIYFLSFVVAIFLAGLNAYIRFELILKDFDAPEVLYSPIFTVFWVLLSFAFLGLVVAIFGQVFPASALGKITSFKTAWKRLKGQRARTIGAYFLATGPAAFAYFFIVALQPTWLENASPIIFLMISQFLHIFILLLSCATLSQIYQKTEPDIAETFA